MYSHYSPGLEPDWALISGIVGPILAMWIVGFGMARMIGKHAAYWTQSKKLFLWPFKAAWKRYKQLIIGIGIGVIVTLILTQR